MAHKPLVVAAAAILLVAGVAWLAREPRYHRKDSEAELDRLRDTETAREARLLPETLTKQTNDEDLGLWKIPCSPEARHISVYVYDLPTRFSTDILSRHGDRWDSCDRFMFRAETTIHQRLQKSSVRTFNIRKADYFYVPVYAACSLTHEGWQASGALLNDAWAYLIKSFGADHIEATKNRHIWPMTRTLGLREFTSSTDCKHGACALDADVLNGIRSGILLSHFMPREGITWNGVELTDRRDISIPYDLLAQLEPYSYFSSGHARGCLAHTESQQRKYLASFHGRVDSQLQAGFQQHQNIDMHQQSDIISRPRVVLGENFANDSEIRIVDINAQSEYTGSPVRWLDDLRDSRFYLCPSGAGPQTTRFFETLYVGRVPVLIGDVWRLPFEEFIDYSKFRWDTQTADCCLNAINLCC